MPFTKPTSLFDMVQQAINSHEGEAGEVIFSDYRCYRAKNDWESQPRNSTDWQYLLESEKAANSILCHLYQKVDPLSFIPHDATLAGPCIMLNDPFQQYPAAQLREHLRKTKQTIQSSFKVVGDSVQFPAFLPSPENFPLVKLVTTLIGTASTSGLPTITRHPNCTISMKNAKKIAPLLELTLAMGRSAGD